MLIRLRAWLGVLLAFGCVVSVWAQDEGPLRLSIEQSLSFDSNLFRLPVGTDALAATGNSSGAEQINMTSLGLNFTTSLGLQQFEVALHLVDSQYLSFGYLNATLHNYNAAWRWSLTPQLHGVLMSERKESLNSFSDYAVLGPDRQRNLRNETSTRLDAVYEIDGPWRVVGGLVQTSQTNEKLLVGQGDYSSTSVNAGVGYAFSSGSLLTLVRKDERGQYLNRVVALSDLNDDEFHQSAHDLRLHWMLAGNNSADVSVAYVNRMHPNFPQRNFSGFNTGASLYWLFTGKSALTLGHSRELAVYASSDTNYSQTDRILLMPTWQVSSKTLLSLRHEWARIDYLGSPGIAASQRSDMTRDTALTLSWKPNRQITLSAARQNATRSSSQTGLDYDSRMALLSAKYTY